MAVRHAKKRKTKRSSICRNRDLQSYHLFECNCVTAMIKLFPGRISCNLPRALSSLNLMLGAQIPAFCKPTHSVPSITSVLQLTSLIESGISNEKFTSHHPIISGSPQTKLIVIASLVRRDRWDVQHASGFCFRIDGTRLEPSFSFGLSFHASFRKTLLSSLSSPSGHFPARQKTFTRFAMCAPDASLGRRIFATGTQITVLAAFVPTDVEYKCLCDLILRPACSRISGVF